MNIYLILFIKNIIQIIKYLFLKYIFNDKFKYQLNIDSYFIFNLLITVSFKFDFFIYYIICYLQIIYTLKINGVLRSSYHLVPIFF